MKNEEWIVEQQRHEGAKFAGAEIGRFGLRRRVAAFKAQTCLRTPKPSAAEAIIRSILFILSKNPCSSV
jgi:hypothetical protein